MGESLCELTEIEDREAAALQVLEWGFPRPIYIHEVRYGFWFRMDEDVIFWFEPLEQSADLGVHLAVAPHRRKRWPVHRWHEAMKQAAHWLGAGNLHYEAFAGPNGDKITEYLYRLGWTEGGYGMVLPLEG